MKIQIEKQKLTDGSEVFAVVMCKNNQKIVLNAYTERDANQLFAVLKDSISRNTVDIIEF